MKKFVVAFLTLFVVFVIFATAISGDPLSSCLARLLGWQTEWKIFAFEMGLVTAALTAVVFLLRKPQERG
jgi:hypothetical protein